MTSLLYLFVEVYQYCVIDTPSHTFLLLETSTAWSQLQPVCFLEGFDLQRKQTCLGLFGYLCRDYRLNYFFYASASKHVLVFLYFSLRLVFRKTSREITPLSSLYLPHILASDSVDVQGNAYSTATLLQSSPIATKQQANAAGQQSSEDGFFYPQEQTLQGRGKVDSYFFAVHASRYGKEALGLYFKPYSTLSRWTAFGVFARTLASDSTVAIEVEVTLYAGENPFEFEAAFVFQGGHHKL